MRILIHDYAGHAFPTDLSRELARRGHEVCHAFASNLVTPRGDLSRRSSDAATLQFKEVHMDPRYREWKYSFTKRRHLEVAYGKAAAAWIKEFRPELVLSGNTPTDSQIHLLRATRSVGGRFISWVQDFYGIAVEKIVRKKFGALGWPIGRYYRWLDRRILRQSDHCIGITEDFVPLLRSEGVPPERISTIPNWAILDEISVLPKDNAWARRHGLHDKFVFLYSGTLGLKHNPALLSGLASQFHNRDDVRIVVVSEGPGADWLKKMQTEDPRLANLLLLPYQPFAELPQLLATGNVLIAILEPDAGVFSVPSKVLSYLCAARPLLLAMPSENLAARMVLGAGAGFVCKPSDEATFTNHAKTLIENHITSSEKGNNARRYANQNFGIEAITDTFLQILSAPH